MYNILKLAHAILYKTYTFRVGGGVRVITETMITTLGFPVALCVVFVYFILYEHPKREYKMQKALQKTLAELNANIRELTTLIKNNNLAAFVVELKKDVAEVKEEAIKIKARLYK